MKRFEILYNPYNNRIHFRQELPQAAVIVSPLAHNTSDDRRKTNLAAGGQVRALGDQTAGNAQGDQETDRCIAEQVCEVAPGEEVLHRTAHHDCRDQQQEDDGVPGDNFDQSLSETELFVSFHLFCLLDYSNCVA